MTIVLLLTAQISTGQDAKHRQVIITRYSDHTIYNDELHDAITIHNPNDYAILLLDYELWVYMPDKTLVFDNHLPNFIPANESVTFHIPDQEPKPTNLAFGSTIADMITWQIILYEDVHEEYFYLYQIFMPKIINP